MQINEICVLLKKELLNNNYEYGFCLNGVKYKPDMSNEFDNDFFNRLSTDYRIQNPSDTMKEKIGTCNDIVVLMKSILDENDIPSKIWVLRNLQKNKYHTVLTFSAEGKTIYLELTPQSKKPWYGKEIIYDSDQDFLSEYKDNEYKVYDVTSLTLIGKNIDELLSELIH